MVNNVTGELYKEGEIFKNPQLAETLEKVPIASDPVKMFYSGEMAQEMANDINSKGSVRKTKF